MAQAGERIGLEGGKFSGKLGVNSNQKITKKMAESNKTKNENTEAETSASSPTAPSVGQKTAIPPVAPTSSLAVEPPTPPVAATPAPPGEEKSKTPVWAWLLIGCAGLLIITSIVAGILIWLAYRQAKSVILQYKPTVQQTQNNLDMVNEEAAKWQEKSQKIRENLPDLEKLKNLGEDLPQQE